MPDELTRRNTESVFQSIRSMEVRLQDAMIMIDAQNQAIASINTRVTALETSLNLLRITKMGTGPTQRGEDE